MSAGLQELLKFSHGVASKAHHGSAPWCTPSPAGVTAEDRAHLIDFNYNDIASLEAAADASERPCAASCSTRCAPAPFCYAAR
jgi:glutamate-1-semialdehyde aminotransferase